MSPLSTLPSTREQARHALLLLGTPAPVRLVAEVHAALFDGDLSVPALAAVLRDEERTLTASAGAEWAFTADAGAERASYPLCPGLSLDLAPVRGIVTLGFWPVADRICSPAAGRAGALAVMVRIAEIAPVRPGTCTVALLRRLAADVPGGPEAFDPLNPAALADVARAALADPELTAALAAEEPARTAAAERAAGLSRAQQWFGVPTVPHQRGPA